MLSAIDRSRTPCHNVPRLCGRGWDVAAWAVHIYIQVVWTLRSSGRDLALGRLLACRQCLMRLGTFQVLHGPAVYHAGSYLLLMAALIYSESSIRSCGLPLLSCTGRRVSG
jgi:hypothetical protein